MTTPSFAYTPQDPDRKRGSMSLPLGHVAADAPLRRNRRGPARSPMTSCGSGTWSTITGRTSATTGSSTSTVPSRSAARSPCKALDARARTTDTIHVCYAGGMTSDYAEAKDTMTRAQEQAFVRISLDIHRRYGITADGHVGHNEFANKACPSYVVDDKVKKWLRHSRPRWRGGQPGAGHAVGSPFRGPPGECQRQNHET